MKNKHKKRSIPQESSGVVPEGFVHIGERHCGKFGPQDMASAFVELPASPSKGASSKGLAAGRISVPVTVRLNGVGLTLGAEATGVDVALLVSAVMAAGGRP